MTLSTPLRLTILHLLQIFFTDALTFIWCLLYAGPGALSGAHPFRPLRKAIILFLPVGDPSPCQIVGRKLHRNRVAGQNFDEMHPHFPGDMRQYLMSVFQLDPEHRIGQGLNHLALDLNRLLFGH
jgi:hypothetical protein